MKTRSLEFTARLLLVVIVAFTAVAIMLLTPRDASALTVVSPAAGEVIAWPQFNPAVAVSLAEGESVKWVVLYADEALTQPTRFCSEIVDVPIRQGDEWYVHRGCDGWAIGRNTLGLLEYRSLKPGTTYYMQVTYTDKDGAEHVTDMRSFSLAATPDWMDPASVSELACQVAGCDGDPNVGPAAFALSGVKTPSVKIGRMASNRFRFAVAFNGGVDLEQSYVLVRSRAGTRKLPLVTTGVGTAHANWTRSKREQKLRASQQVYRYQLMLKSTKNGAMVRSKLHIAVIKPRPKWKRTA